MRDISDNKKNKGGGRLPLLGGVSASLGNGVAVVPRRLGRHTRQLRLELARLRATTLGVEI